MGNIYVKLKDEYFDGKAMRKISDAKDILGTLIYPGAARWRIFKDSQLELIKNHRDYNLLDIKTQEDIDNENTQYQQWVEEIACEQHLKAKKTIAMIIDKQKLNDIAKKAKELQKNKVCQIALDRLEELNY